MVFERIRRAFRVRTGARGIPAAAPRYQLIGFQPEVRSSEIHQAVAQRLSEMANPKPSWNRMSVLENNIQGAFSIACIHSLQIAKIDDIGSVLHTGVNSAIDLLFGDWWQVDENVHSRHDADLYIESLTPLAEGLLLAILAERWADVDRLFDWLLQIEISKYYGLQIEIAALYAVIASTIRGGSPEKVVSFRELIAKKRTKKAKRLLQAWDAVANNDAGLATKAITESLERFDKTVAKQEIGFAFSDLIAQPESVIWGLADRYDMTLHAVPEILAPYLITRKSLDLPNLLTED